MSSLVSILYILKNNSLDIINNILNQTYVNFELILIDKFSNFKNIIDLIKNEKIKYLNKDLSNDSELIDFGLKKTNGKFIFIANENNIYNKQCIEIFVESLNNSKWSDISYSGYLFNNKKEVDRCIIPLEFLLKFNLNHPVMFRKKSLENIKFNSKLNNLSIFDMYLQILENNKHLIPINNILTTITTFIKVDESEIINFIENLLFRNKNILDVNKYYPFSNNCKDKKRFICISNYDLAMNIINTNSPLKKYLIKNIYKYFEISYNIDNKFIPSLINLLISIDKKHEDYDKYYKLLTPDEINIFKNNLENNIYFLENLKNEEIIMKKRIYIKRNSINIERKNLDMNNNFIDNIIKKNNKLFIYYSKTPWNLLFQRPHQICKFFDKSFLKVFICSETDICTYDEKYNLLIVSYINKDIIFNNINNFYEKIIYYTDPRLFNEIKKKQENDFKILFDLIDAPIDEFSVWKPNLENSVKNADWVIYSHPKLLEFLNEIDDKKEYNYISNACDYEHFSKAKERIYPKPSDIPEVSKPILGYYGAFSEWLDYELIKKYADEGKYHILMIGGISNNSKYNIRFKHENITWLEHKKYEELPIYLSWFDVCFLPFKECELIKYVNPCKLWEYIASEKEIIKSGINIDCDKLIKYEDECDKIKIILNSEINEFNNFNDFKKNIISKYKYVFVTLPTIPYKSDLYQRPQHIANSFAKLGDFLSIYVTIYKEDNLNVKFKKLEKNLWITTDTKNILTIKGAYFSFYSTVFYIDYLSIYDTIKKNYGYLIYEYIDHIDEKITGNQENCKILSKIKNMAFDSCSDLIVSSANKLFEETKNYIQKNSIIIKNGVSVNHYLLKKNNKYILPDNVLKFSNKYKIICGYFGAIAPWLDYEIIRNIVKKRKDIGFIFIGPDYLDNVKKLPIENNFLYLGAIQYNILPYYAFIFNISFIPFEKGEIAKTTSPLKLYEYFSLQIPVITSSEMLECINYKEVIHYDSLEELNEALNKSILLIDNKEYKNKLLNLAYENDWIKKAESYSIALKNLKNTNKSVKPNYQILISNNINKFSNNINKFQFINKWGCDVCAIKFNKNEFLELNIDNTINYKNLEIKVFSINVGLLNIILNNVTYTFSILGSLKNYNISLLNNKELNIKITTNIPNEIYFSGLYLY